MHEAVEKTFVRFHDFFILFCMFRNSVFLEKHCAIRSKEAGVHSSHPQPEFTIMYDKKGKCKVPGCKGTPKGMYKKCNIHLCFTAEKKRFLKFNTE